MAAAVSAVLCRIEPDRVAEALRSFCGAGRRMQKKGVLNGAVVYDDYGHHPAEIKATLAAAKSMGFQRVICAYQPHTYSRTAGLFGEFSEALSDADVVLLTDIYAAREQNIYGVSSSLLAKRIGERAHYCNGFSDLANQITALAREGDLIVVMGAGDIFKTFQYLNLEAD
jgi:UDP-N-acetylmuramate--alanine ligase